MNQGTCNVQMPGLTDPKQVMVNVLQSIYFTKKKKVKQLLLKQMLSTIATT